MGRFDALAKALGLALEKYGDDAAKILEKVDSPELATSLKGAERGEYLKALDDVYGDQAKRAKDLGFGEEIYYHGTKNKFDQFKPSSGGSAGRSVYLTENKNVAERYRPEGGAMFKGHIRNKDIMDLTVSDEMGLKNLESAADKLGVRDEFDKMKFKGGNAYYDLMRAYENKNPNAFEGLRGAERENAFTEKVKELTGAKGFKFSQNGIENYSTNVFDPKDIRSSKAAFDPRFKDSPLLMAGALAAPMGKQVVDMNPLQDIKAGFDVYDQGKEKLAKALASQINIGRNPQDEAYMTEAIKMGADPINFVPGAGGMGLGLIQAASSMMPNKKDPIKTALERSRSNP